MRKRIDFVLKNYDSDVLNRQDYSIRFGDGADEANLSRALIEILRKEWTILNVGDTIEIEEAEDEED